MYACVSQNPVSYWLYVLQSHNATCDDKGNDTVVPLLRDHLKNIKKRSLKSSGLTLEVHSID